MKFTTKQLGAVAIVMALSFTSFLSVVYFQHQVLAQGVSDRRRERAKELIDQGRREEAERLIRQGNQIQNNSNSNFNKEDPCSMIYLTMLGLKKSGIQLEKVEKEDLLQDYLREDNLIDAYLLLEDKSHSGAGWGKDLLLVLANRERTISDTFHLLMKRTGQATLFTNFASLLARSNQQAIGSKNQDTVRVNNGQAPLENIQNSPFFAFKYFPYLVSLSNTRLAEKLLYYPEVLESYETFKNSVCNSNEEKYHEVVEKEKERDSLSGFSPENFYGPYLEKFFEQLRQSTRIRQEKLQEHPVRTFNEQNTEDHIELMKELTKIIREDENIPEIISQVETLQNEDTSEILPRILPDRKEQIKAISKTQNSFIVQYFITYTNNNFGSANEETTILVSSENPKGKTIVTSKEEAKLLISVIPPNGEITVRLVDLQSIDTPIKDIIPDLRRKIDTLKTKTRGNNKDEPSFKEGDTIKIKNNSDGGEYTVKSVDLEKREILEVHPEIPTPLSFDQVYKVEQTTKTTPQLQKLHEILIDPIADLLPQDPNQQVIFIPHKELFLVPFPALQDKQGKYLIEKHTITTAPAIQVLDLTRKQKQRIAAQPKQDVLVVGNPTMPKSLENLPHAENEAKAVAEYYNTKAFTGNQATETAIASQLPNYRIIHLATHGLLDEIEPLESSIALAPDSNENGFLTAAELLNMELNAELIVLSACDTGKGRITGDGVVGLSRSLAIAGVPSILVSLWKIDDESTKELMIEFYKNLEQGNNKAQSLRQAMLTMMEKYGVYHWAAFNLIGEAE